MATKTINLNEENLILYARDKYINPYCISYEEFLDDFRIFSTIMRMISLIADIEDVDRIRIRRLVNNTVTLFNLFDMDASINILEFKIQDENKEKVNSVLKYLSYPLLGNKIYNKKLYGIIEEEYNEKY